MTYSDFLLSKTRAHDTCGFKVESLNTKLFSFQSFIVSKALEKGRYAIFADCGLGKTFMQLEWGHQIAEYKRKPVLLVCPLAVGAQTMKEASKFGYGDVGKIGSDTPIEIVNYQNLDKVNLSKYSGIILDESSILKNHEGAYRNLLIEQSKKMEFRLACTATPAPNDPMELGNHSEFLGSMSRQEMLSMFFVHDGGETSKWRLKGHAHHKFYEFVRQWAVMITKPSDLGYDDDGYILPSLNYIERQIKTANKGLSLYNDIAISATDFNAELRRTMIERMDVVADIVNNSNENFVVWIKQDAEGQLLRKLIPGSIEVKGSDDDYWKEEMLLGFAENKFRVLITKTSIASFGLNYQNCSNTIFASLDFSFEKLYQGIRRFLRFGQLHDVNAYLITTDTMQNVANSIKKKEIEFKKMQYLMTKEFIKHGN